MLYLFADTTEYELPLAVADTQAEAARICGVRPSYISRIIKDGRNARIFNGIPAKVYKISDEENENEQSSINPQSAEINRAV